MTASTKARKRTPWQQQRKGGHHGCRSQRLQSLEYVAGHRRGRKKRAHCVASACRHARCQYRICRDVRNSRHTESPGYDDHFGRHGSGPVVYRSERPDILRAAAFLRSERGAHAHGRFADQHESLDADNDLERAFRRHRQWRLCGNRCAIGSCDDLRIAGGLRGGGQRHGYRAVCEQ